MRIGVDGEAIRLGRQHGVDRLRETLQVLLRQAVDEVHAHRPEAELAGLAYQPQRVGHGLDPVDGLLHQRVEILDAEAAAVEADARQVAQRVAGDGARVELDGVFAARIARQLEVAAELLDQPVDLERCQERRRAAAEVQLLDLTVAVVELALQLDLAMQAVQVGLGLLVVAGDDLGAAAVETGARAEGDVHVQRQWPRNRVLVARERRRPVLGKPEAVGELHRRRVRRIARARPVVATDEVDVEADLVRIHLCL